MELVSEIRLKFLPENLSTHILVKVSMHGTYGLVFLGTACRREIEP